MTVFEGAATFLGIAALMAALACALVLPSLLRYPRPRGTISRAEVNAAIYRSQIVELDQALAAGTLSDADHRRCVDDILRNALSADTAPPVLAKEPRSRGAAVAVMLALPTLAVGVYLCVGNPAALSRDEPMDLLALDAGVSRAAIPGWIARLEQHLAHNPRDGRGWVVLGRLQSEIERHAEAAQSYEKAVAVSRKIAQDPQVLCELADALGMVQGGSLRGRPRELIDRALGLKGAHPRALEMAGSAEYEAGNFRRVLDYWEPLLAQLAPDSQAHRELTAAIERARSHAARVTGPFASR